MKSEMGNEYYMIRYIEKIEKGFEIIDVCESYFKVIPKFDHETSFNIVFKEFENEDAYPVYRKKGKDYILFFIKKRERKSPPMVVNIILLILTFITVTYAGYLWWTKDIAEALMFSLALLFILGIHELAHAVVARKHKTKSSLPYFIPLPPHVFPFGTMGAVILMKSPIKNRKALIDIGIAGPLASFLASIPIIAIGLSLSTVVPLEEVEKGEILFASPPIITALSKLILKESGAIDAHVLVMAGWIGIFVTFINLLPIGQLDGGHVVRALFPNKYKKIYLATLITFLFLSIFWIGWLFWVLIVYALTKANHPGPLNDVSDIGTRGKILGILMLVIIILSLMPVPVIFY